MKPQRHRLCAQSAIAEGQARGFDPLGAGRDLLFIVRHQGSLYAYRNDCPHVAGAPMAWRVNAYLNADASRIVCSAHGAQFDIPSGVCTLGPCLGQALRSVALENASDGDLYLLLQPPPGTPS